MLGWVTMRLASAVVLLTATLAFDASAGGPPRAPTATSANGKTVAAPVVVAPPDVREVLRAMKAVELPKSLTTNDKTALAAVVAELRADRWDAAYRGFRTWTNGAVKRVSPEDMNAAALATYREGVLTRRADIADAADRFRFFDERSTALDESLASVRAAGARTGSAVSRVQLVMVTAYAPHEAAANKHEQVVSRDDVPAQMKTLEAQEVDARTQREQARAALKAIEQRDPAPLQILARLLRAGDESRAAVK